MFNNHQEIDEELASQCKQLEQRGVPLDLSELNLRVFKKTRELNRLKEDLNGRFGFVPSFSDESTWRRVYRGTTGHEIPVLSPQGKVSLSRKTVEMLKEDCPYLIDVYQGLQWERLISQMGKVVGSTVETQGQFAVKPLYRIDSNSGQVFLRDPNLRTWAKEIKGTVRIPGHVFVLIWYDALELTVLQDLSQDPVLESDLESVDPYRTMACRFWETPNPSSTQVFITRMAFTLFCNGVKPTNFFYSMKTTYAGQCSLDFEDAERLYEKFIQHYTVSCEYFNRIFRMAAAPQSLFGRRGVDSQSRCYGMTATVTDITKLGFLSVLDDSRLERLGVQPLALVANKMLLSVPRERDLGQVSGYLLDDFQGAYPKYALKVCITTGDSWGDCDVAGNDYPEE